MTKVGELRQTRKMIKGRRVGMPFQVINVVPRADVVRRPTHYYCSVVLNYLFLAYIS